MKFLLKNARLLHENQPPSNSLHDLLINNGIIERIADSIETLDKTTTVFDAAGACVSIGFMDVGTQVCDPGFEHREDLESASRAAVAGGFTALATQPNTEPVIHSKSEILYLKNKSRGLPIEIFPIGAVSHDAKGTDLAELFDMHAAGAVAFSDGSKSIQNEGLLLRAMQYVLAFNGLILNNPFNKNLVPNGQMHEGKMSTSLGLKGIPALAEEMMILRDLQLTEYAGGRLHFSNISTARSVAMIRLAKSHGQKITCSVAVANLFFTDDDLENFDSNLKISPPARLETDRQALLDGLADGTIDFISSGHTPWDEESKNLEFTFAQFGIIGLETCFSISRTVTKDRLPINILIEKLAAAPRRVLGLAIPKIEVGAVAELTIFQPDESWVFSENDIRSKSRNTPFIGRELTGRVVGVFSKGQFWPA